MKWEFGFPRVKNNRTSLVIEDGRSGYLQASSATVLKIVGFNLELFYINV
jgi:hypothetical protein